MITAERASDKADCRAMSMLSNTNPKLAKMQKTASRKTMMAQRGDVFHALDCGSSRDFDRIMLSPRMTRPSPICALDSVSAGRPANPGFGFRIVLEFRQPLFLKMPQSV